MKTPRCAHCGLPGTESNPLDICRVCSRQVHDDCYMDHIKSDTCDHSSAQGDTRPSEGTPSGVSASLTGREFGVLETIPKVGDFTYACKLRAQDTEGKT